MRKNNSKKAILIGTYNGERFIKDQLKSIQRQIDCDSRIFIRDDISTDNTLDIIDKIANQDRRIIVLEGNGRNLGVVENYNVLMKVALEWGAEKVFICDQDDIWCTNKMRLQTELIDQYEKAYGQSNPILVHTDLFVVDADLQVLSNSFFKSLGLQPEKQNSINFLLAQNHVTGCTCALNRALLKIVTPIPDGAVMHDWWLALCAASFGRIALINRPLTLYRQHGNNLVGVRKLSHVLRPPLLKNVLHQWQTGHSHFKRSIDQAAALQNLISEIHLHATPYNKKLIAAYASCRNEGRLKRFSTIVKNGIRRQGILFQFLFYLRLLSSPTFRNTACLKNYYSGN